MELDWVIWNWEIGMEKIKITKLGNQIWPKLVAAKVLPALVLYLIDE